MKASPPKNAKKAFLFTIIGSLVYLLGVGSIVLWPENAHHTYMSENALMPGSAVAEYTSSDVARAEKYSKFEFNLRNNTPEQKIQKLADLMISLGLETMIHNYTTLNGENAYNLYSIARAYKSNGVEATVLSTTYNDLGKRVEDGEVNGFGFMASVVQHLSTRKWLSKDILFVATDAQHGDQGTNQWLHTYLYGTTAINFPRGGAIQAAINLKLSPTANRFDQLAILIDGPNGQLPNLDLVNTVQRVTKREGVPDTEIVLSKPGSSLICPPFPIIRDATYTRYATMRLRTLLTFMMNQAYGVPTGNHGLFNRYTIDSVTITDISNGGSQQVSIYQLGRIVENTMRSINNLLEHLHQSFYYYLLPSPSSYISIGEYMISFGLVMFGFTIRNALAVLALPYNDHVTRSLLVVSSFALTGILLFSLPHTIEAVAEYSGIHVTGSEVMMAWSGISAVLNFIVYFAITPIIEMAFKSSIRLDSPDETRTIRASAFKTLASVVPIVALAAASLQNFSFAFFAATIFIPLYALIFPSNVIFNWIQRLILIATSPPVVLQGISMLLRKDVFAILATMVDHYQLYSTLFFPFLCLVYIPTHCVLLKLLNVA